MSFSQDKKSDDELSRLTSELLAADKEYQNFWRDAFVAYQNNRLNSKVKLKPTDVKDAEVKKFREQLSNEQQSKKDPTDYSQTTWRDYKAAQRSKEEKLNLFCKKLLGVDQEDIIKTSALAANIKIPDLKNLAPTDAQLVELSTQSGNLSSQLSLITRAKKNYENFIETMLYFEADPGLKESMEKIYKAIVEVEPKAQAKLADLEKFFETLNTIYKKMVTETHPKKPLNPAVRQVDHKTQVQKQKADRKIGSDVPQVKSDQENELDPNVMSAQVLEQIEKRKADTAVNPANNPAKEALEKVYVVLKEYRDKLAGQLDEKRQRSVATIAKEDLLNELAGAIDKNTLIKYAVVKALVEIISQEKQYGFKVQKISNLLNAPIKDLFKDKNQKIQNNRLFEQSPQEVLLIKRDNLTFLQKAKGISGASVLKKINALLPAPTIKNVPR